MSRDARRPTHSDRYVNVALAIGQDASPENEFVWNVLDELVVDRRHSGNMLVVFLADAPECLRT